MDTALNTRLLAALPPRSSIQQRDRIVDYEIVEMATLFRIGELTSYAITVAYLQRIDEFNGPFETYDANGGYNAFVRIDRVEALQQARLADLWLQNPNDERGPAPPLCGIPLGAKDVIAIAGRESKNGSHVFDTNWAIKDATCVAKLREQGAVLIGHTMCSEFSASTDGDFGGNAWDPTRVPGGSSSGSGIAPMARLCAGALAEETGGSLIIPAAANGASGIKPSLGLVSTAGVMPYSIGVDVVGPIARSMRDASLILAVTAGVDQFNDPLTLSAPIPSLELPIQANTHLERPLEGITLGVPQTDWMYRPGQSQSEPPASSYDADYRQAFERFKTELIDLGANLIDFPGLDMSIEQNRVYYAGPTLIEVGTPPSQVFVTPTMATTYTNQFEAHYWQAVADFALTRPPMEKEILLGRYNPDYYHPIVDGIPYSIRVEAEDRRRDQQALWQKALDDHGVDFMLVLPLGSHIGLRFDDGSGITGIRTKRSHYALPNSIGWPMVTFPIGHNSTGVEQLLPINAAFWGPRFSEVLIIQAAIDFQANSNYHREAPPDPTISPLRPEHCPRVPEIRPDNSADPLMAERGLKWAR